MDRYDRDNYGQIVNGEGTYSSAADELQAFGPVVLNWVHSRGTFYNILLALNPQRVGALGGLVDGSGSKLWVGIAGRGCFGFNARGGYLSPEYVAEKLGLSSLVDAEPVAELLTGIRAVLAEQMR